MDPLEQKWATRYSAMMGLWRTAWSESIPFLDYDLNNPPGHPQCNAIESLNARY